jgi:hypothetical protein
VSGTCWNGVQFLEGARVFFFITLSRSRLGSTISYPVVTKDYFTNSEMGGMLGFTFISPYTVMCRDMFTFKYEYLNATVPHQPQISSICSYIFFPTFASCRIWKYISCFLFDCVHMERVCGFCTEGSIFARGRTVVVVMQLPYCYCDVAFHDSFLILFLCSVKK